MKSSLSRLRDLSCRRCFCSVVVCLSMLWIPALENAWANKWANGIAHTKTRMPTAAPLTNIGDGRLHSFLRDRQHRRDSSAA
jgi:hypothetical protein